MGATTIDLNKLMNRIQSLLGLADQPGIATEAADGYRQRAESLMREYRVAEEGLIASDQVEIAPEVRKIWLGPTKDSTRGTATDAKRGKTASYYDNWYSLAYHAARHAGVRIHYQFGVNHEVAQRGIYAVMVGYSGDLRLAEMLYTNARIVFGNRVEPKVDPALSDQLNAYRLRSAGITRRKVAEMIWGECTHARAANVAQWYKEECERRGETPVLDGRGVSASAYRDSFANAFVREFSARLRQARDAADSVGGALSLHGREERVAAAFYKEFPELEPTPATDVAKADAAPAKQRKRKNYWDTAAGRAELQRHSSSAAEAGRAAGSRAAQDVELTRASTAKRLDEATHFPTEWALEA